MPNSEIIRCVDCANYTQDRDITVDDSLRCCSLNRYSYRPLTPWVCDLFKAIRYQSRNGFQIIPIIRGFTLIHPLWEVLQNSMSAVKEGKCYICGGYARWCASPKFEPTPPTDIDVYCENENIYNALTRQLTDIGLIRTSSNAMADTYDKTKVKEFKCLPPIQVIKPFNRGAIVAKGTINEVLNNFDFTVVRVGITSPTTVLADADFLYDESNNNLRLKNIHCPVSSLLRVLKYSKRGYWMRPLETLKLFQDWDERKPEYREKIVEFIAKANNGSGLTQEEVDDLEALMRID